jgi:hypothetical protein
VKNTETVKQAYGDNSVSHTRVYEWYLKKGVRISRTIQEAGVFNISKCRHNPNVRKTLIQDRRWALRMMAVEFNINCAP